MGKRFTDLFIKRPVLATVVSLLILILGIRSFLDLPVRQFPKIENTVITVTTAYPGASAQLVEGFLTSPIEKRVASADGVDYIVSESNDNVSTIKAYIKLNFNPNIAFTSVLSKVAEARADLPVEAEPPVIKKETGSSTALMYIGFNSDEMTPEQITDYISRVVQPKLETVSGVAQAQILGGKIFAMRIWLNPKEMAAFGITPNDVADALRRNNFQTTAGKIKGRYIEVTINAKTDVTTVKGFSNIVVKRGTGGALVRLSDVATVELGSQTYDSSVIFNGKKATFVGINATPSANPLNVITNVKKVLPEIKRDYPPTLSSKVVYDATKYIRSSIDEVLLTIFEATLIVIVVIFLFLGSLRTVIVPIVTIPLSLIGVMFFMRLLGYSINLLTLLAMVLAIGMVVDDAIVVVENIYRHIEGGMKPFDAAIKGAREIAMPVISMTITLAAVYAPIGFMGGLTGALFKEFAFTLASTVIISGIIALSLSPMMCSKLLTSDIGKKKLVHKIDQVFGFFKLKYEASLNRTLQVKPVMLLFAFVVLVSCIFLYTTASKELAPVEDKGAIFLVAQGPEYANLNYMEKFTNQFNAIYRSFNSMEDYFIVNGMGTVSSVISAMIMKPWDQRSMSQKTALKLLKEKMSTIAGLRITAFPLPPLPTTGSDLPVQFVITSIYPYRTIYPLMEQLVTKAQKSGLFLFVFGDLLFNKPQIEININRSKAAQMGIDMQDIGRALSASLSENYVNRFNLQGRSYKVIPLLRQVFRLTPDAINHIYIKTISNQLIPLSSVVSISLNTEPNSRTRFQQLNSASIQGVMRPGNTLDQGLTFLRNAATKTFPQGVSYDYAGQSRQLVEEGSALMYTFVFSILVIFLVLAAQFESFKDPLVIMLSVPMAISGALLPLSWGLATVNIYTQIGLITLIGLISKHGILMVEFANQLQINEGLDSYAAIKKAAAIRLRPVLMTTFSMILGVTPLIVATGAGAASRFDIGLVIATGMFIGTLFTLFVVPTMYTLKVRGILLFLAFVAFVGFGLYLIAYGL